MVTLYADGKPIPWADAERVVPECLARNQRVELRNDTTGQPLGVFTPAPTPLEPIVPWEPNVTQEEYDRRLAEPGLSFEEVKKRLGWE